MIFSILRKEPEMKTEQRQSPTQDDAEEDTTPADIQDPSNYKEIFQPKKRLCKFTCV